MKPPLLLGLNLTHSLGVSNCLTTNIVHLISNMSDLLIQLWRDEMKCAPTNHIDTWDWAVLRDANVWKEHGRTVNTAGLYLPGSFHIHPQDIAEKLNADYKTREFQMYMFSLAPALLCDILPFQYWCNFCRLV